MYLVDTHIHLDHERYAEDLPEVIERAKQGDVKAIITQGVNTQTNKIVLELAKKYGPLVKPALGIYPCFASNVKAEWLEEDGYGQGDPTPPEETLQFIREHKDEIVCIGEVGLDYKESDDKESQRENFKKVIELAKEIKKPLSIHSRKAEADVIELLEASGINKNLVVLHCFSGKKKLIKRGAELGYTFSVPCNITRAHNFQMLVELVPITQLLTETDGPYLPADGYDRSEPAHVKITAEIIAEIKGMTPQEVADSIFMNYQRLFL